MGGCASKGARDTASVLSQQDFDSLVEFPPSAAPDKPKAVPLERSNFSTALT